MYRDLSVQSDRKPVDRHTRYVASIPCTLIRTSDGRTLKSEVVDVSRTGLRIASGARVAIGERLRVVFRDPLWKLRVEMTGAVSRVAHGRRRNDDGLSFALSIREMSGWSGYLLAQVLCGRVPVRAAR